MYQWGCHKIPSEGWKERRRVGEPGKTRYKAPMAFEQQRFGHPPKARLLSSWYLADSQSIQLKMSPAASLRNWHQACSKQIRIATSFQDTKKAPPIFPGIQIIHNMLVIIFASHLTGGLLRLLGCSCRDSISGLYRQHLSWLAR